MTREGAHPVYKKVEGKFLLQKEPGKALAETDGTGKSMTRLSPSMPGYLRPMKRALGLC